MNNLAWGYQATGKLDQAVPLYEECLKLRKAKIGADHPNTHLTMYNLASAYRVTGKLDQSVLLFEECLKFSKAQSGADHPGTLTTMNELATTYTAAGKLEKALELFEQAATSIEKGGFRYPYTPLLIRNTINTYERDKQFDKAEGWRRKWLAVVKDRSGADSLPYADELAGLGSNLSRQGKFADAEQVLLECLTIREKKRAVAWFIFEAQSRLGAARLGQKKYADAEEALLKGYEGMKRQKVVSAQFRVRLLEAAEDLVKLYEAMDKKDEAARWRKEVEALKAASKPPAKP
jgi:tetratricopeptide (TPR) repeat protein